MISEVQITCAFLMGLFTLFLIFVIPNYQVVGMGYNRARKILSVGAFLVTIHFMIQYNIHDAVVLDGGRLRSLVNLSFGIPISCLFFMSNLCLLHKGELRGWRLWFAPVVFLFSMLTLLTGVLTNQLGVASKFMSALYAVCLVYYGIVQLVDFLAVVKLIRTKQDFSLLLYIKWTRWSLLAMVVVSLGFPLMTFCPNLLFRSFYGLVSISIGFFYICSFMGYGVGGLFTPANALRHGIEEITENAVSFNSDSQYQYKDVKLDRLKSAIDEFEKGDKYLQTGITIGEVADALGVSIYALRTWLRTSEYVKYNNWIMHLRLKRAEEMLLRHPELGNDVIAERCGFCDRQYFQRQFRKFVGVTPAKWVKDMAAATEVATDKADIAPED